MAQVDSESSTTVPAEAAGEVFSRTDISPEQIFQAIGRLRKEARDEIDRLIRFLDDTDGHMSRDPDLEPSLGFLENPAMDEDDEPQSHGNTDDREQDGDELDASYPDDGPMFSDANEDDEEGGDDEPWLGSTVDGDAHETRDLEHDASDCEPTLGWPERMDQTACPGNSDDREEGVDARPPQQLTEIGAGVSVELSYRRSLRGLTPEQRSRILARQHERGI